MASNTSGLPLAKMAEGIARPVIDTQVKLEDIEGALHRIESRQVFGKFVVTL